MIAAISDIPGEWSAAVTRWRARLRPDSDGIYPNDVYLLFQLLVGGWPLEGSGDNFGDRLKGAMIKSLREGRERSDWGVNATAYESALTDFIDRALGDTAFLADFHACRLPLQAIGRRKSLIQAALKLTIPGVPDIYRGAEDWEQSFVDPDNRRSLDFATLAERLAVPMPGRDDKLILTQTLLGLRSQMPALFAAGSYEPIDCGAKTVGYRRRHGSDEVVVLADLSPRHEAGIPAQVPELPTLFGSATGPVWVMVTGR